MTEYKMRTDEECKTIAQDMIAGLIFTDRHTSSADEVSQVFMVLHFMDEDVLKSTLERLGNGGMFYEYLDKAGPRSINGMPCFMSAQTLTTEETDKVFDYIRKITEAVDAV